MKLLCKKLSEPINSSFSISINTGPCLDEHLHFHPEYELILIKKGYGMKLIGGNIYSFNEGDLAFLGPNIPHLWRNDESFYLNSELEAEVVVIQFSEDFLGKDFFQKIEMKHIYQFFNRSKSGLNINGSTHQQITSKINKLIHANDFERILILLDIINNLSCSEELEELSSPGYSHNFTHADTLRMDKVYTYMIDHFQDDIDLKEIASIACMSASAFCKYFKKRTKKTFSEFLNELKIGHACEMLIKGDYSIAQVCYGSGFNSITNFNRQFKCITNLTPHDYRQQYLM
jgi:AraC-like DNA-binding protein